MKTKQNAGMALSVAAICVLAVSWPHTVRAQSWPQRTVKIVTPQPAGTAIDSGLRIIADQLAKRWGQGVVVENRPGGDGILATTSFIQAKDDHALLGTPGYPFTIAPLVMEKLPYDPVSDVTPVTILMETPLMVAAHVGVPVNSMTDLKVLARAEPGRLNWASTAGLPNFAFNFFAKSNALDMAYVSYRDVPSALNDIGEGRIQLYATSYGTVIPQLQGGKIKVLAMLGDARIAAAPAVPTVMEAGFPSMRVVGFSGLFGEKGMLPSLRDRIASEVTQVLQQHAVKELIARNVQVTKGSTPAELIKALDEQRRQVGEMLRATGQLKKAALRYAQ